MPFYAYVLISDEGYHYTGSTENLDTRLQRHHLKTTHFTKKGTNWRILHSKEFSTRSEAVIYEKWLKSGIGREWLKENIPGWSPLNESSTTRWVDRPVGSFRPQAE